MQKFYRIEDKEEDSEKGENENKFYDEEGNFQWQ